MKRKICSTFSIFNSQWHIDIFKQQSIHSIMLLTTCKRNKSISKTTKNRKLNLTKILTNNLILTLPCFDQEKHKYISLAKVQTQSWHTTKGYHIPDEHHPQNLKHQKKTHKSSPYPKNKDCMKLSLKR